MSFDNLYDENAQQQPTEFNPIRISDGTTFPSLFDADRFKVFDAVGASATILGLQSVTGLIGDLGGTIGGSVTERLSAIQARLGETTNGSVNSQLYEIRELLGLTTWVETGSVGNNTILTLTKAGTSNQIHVLTWIDVGYSGTGYGNRATVNFNGTTLLRPKVNGEGNISTNYSPGVATPGANQSIILSLPAIGGLGPQSSAGSMGGYTLSV